MTTRTIDGKLRPVNSVDLTSDVSGILPAANGGTNSTSLLAALTAAGVVIARFSSGILVGIPSSGSFGNNGALTLTTAVLLTVPRFCYFPADKIYVGSAAGLYWTVFSDTSHAVVYNNLYTGGPPAIPASPTPFVCTGPGAYTQTTGADITVASFTLPGGSLGPTGSLTEHYKFAHNSSASARPVKSFIGATQFALTHYPQSNNISSYQLTWHNAGSQSVQVYTPSVADIFAEAAGTFTTGAVDLSVDQTFSVTANLVDAADWIFLTGCDITTRYAP